MARWVAHREGTGERLDPAELCADRPGLADALADAIRRFEILDQTLSFGSEPAAETRR